MSNKKVELGRLTSKTHTRIASLQGIDENMDLGNGRSLVNFQSAYQQLVDAVDAVNSLVDELAGARLRCKELARELNDWNNRILAGVGARYGKDSVEYERAGGTRSSVVRRYKNGKKAA